MSAENKEQQINLTELLLKISSDVSAIKTDMQNFKDSYKSERENLLSKIEDVRSDCEKELLRQEAQLKQMNVYIEAIRTGEDKKDAKRWRTTIAFILTGLGGMLLCRVPDFLMFCLKAMNGGN